MSNSSSRLNINKIFYKSFLYNFWLNLTKPENIFQDNFEDIRSATPVIDNHRCVLCDECLLVKPIENCIVEVAELGFGGDDKVRQYKRVESGSTSGLYYNSLYIDESKCIRCFACVDACPHDAISRKYSIRDSLRQKSYD